MLPKFNDKGLLETALTHRSALNEGISRSEISNERLEYLGDAVLELCSSHWLYMKLPNAAEGELTAYRSALVKTQTLARVAQELGLDQLLKLSKGEENSGGRTNQGLLADTTEAVIGAIYLDQGYQAVEAFLEKHLFPMFETLQKEGAHKDAKSQLQEVVQARGWRAPIYKVQRETGPDHDKEFIVEVLVNRQPRGQGKGKSKQTAQQAAAAAALSALV